MDEKITPKKLLNAIRQKTGHSYSISTAKRILYKNYMTPKSPQRVSINRVSHKPPHIEECSFWLKKNDEQLFKLHIQYKS